MKLKQRKPKSYNRVGKKFNIFIMKNLNSVKSSLSRDEMRSVFGGRRATFTCFCGFTGGPYEDLTVQVEASDVGAALNSMNCGGHGATCSGN